jgi:hypothetical protein
MPGGSLVESAMEERSHSGSRFKYLSSPTTRLPKSHIPKRPKIGLGIRNASQRDMTGSFLGYAGDGFVSLECQDLGDPLRIAVR